MLYVISLLNLMLFGLVLFALNALWRKAPYNRAVRWAAICLMLLISVIFAPMFWCLAFYGLYALWRRTRNHRAVEWATSGLWLALTAFSAHALYDRYWVWQDCFNELGRCYDTDAGVMVEQAGPIWTLFTAIFGFLFLRALSRLRTPRTA